MEHCRNELESRGNGRNQKPTILNIQKADARRIKEEISEENHHDKFKRRIKQKIKKEKKKQRKKRK